MGNKKKKSGKPKQPPQHKGHYCRICGEHKANEKFSGRGHAAHICKACASKSPAQKSEDMTINRLHSMAFRYLNEAEMNWLKNRRNDSRPEVQELARQVFEEKFPKQARNEIKARLHIKNMVFHVRGEVFDNDGDEYIVNAEFTADTSGRIVKKIFDGNDALIEEKSIDIDAKAARKLFNVAVHEYDISFWDTDLCHDNSYDPYIDDFDFDDLDDDEVETDNEAQQPDINGDDTPDDRVSAWSVEIKYKNGTEQKTKGYDYMPDPVVELFEDFDSYFKDELLDDEFEDMFLIDESKLEIGNKCVAELIECQTFDEIKAAIAAFLAAVDEVRDEYNGMLVWCLCRQLTDVFTAWVEPYISVPRGSKLNAVIVPPEQAPLMLLKSFVPINGSPSDIIDALKKFNGRCDEFVPPLCDAITVAEINRVLNAAQKDYRLLDIIAPKEPLKILRFNYSHTVYNSQCGLSDSPDCPATIMLYHPQTVDIYDRVFIFAHELGHALHQTLTGDVAIIPEGFDKFNESVLTTVNSVKEMQECFADAVALAILNSKGLGAHFPPKFSKDISPYFARFLRGLCENALREMGTSAEPLPPPNLMRKAALHPPR